MTDHDTSLSPTRVWDLPTRLFHWALVLAVAGAVLTAQIGGSAMVWHVRLGQTVMALLLFRLLWGLVGGHWSRFAALPLRPGQFRAYLSGQSDGALDTGHSPLGSLAVLGFVLVLGAQVLTGLVSDDEIAFTGPLAHLVSSATSLAATAYHKGWGKLIIVGLVLLHLLAIGSYRLRGRRLVAAMVHGDKLLPASVPASRDDLRSRLGAAVLLAACVAVSMWVFSLAPAGF